MRVEGKEHYACGGCQKKAPKALQVKLRKPGKSHANRIYDSYELPKDVIKATQRARPQVRHPDTPVLRDQADLTPMRPRMRLFEEGSTGKSPRNIRVLNKLTAKLGPNPRILKDDGFEVLAESTVLGG